MGLKGGKSEVAIGGSSGDGRELAEQLLPNSAAGACGRLVGQKLVNWKAEGKLGGLRQADLLQ